MLTVITPATSNRLTTVDRARTHLGFAGAEDEVAEACIEQASQVIADYCRRPFGTETVRETFRGPDPGNGLMLSRSPVTAIASVTSDGVALLTTDYELDPQTGILYRLNGYGSRFRWWWATSLVIQYSGGYTLPADSGTWTLPDSVERAAIRLTGLFLRGREYDPLVKSKSVLNGMIATSYWSPNEVNPNTFLDAEVERLLQPYRRLFG